MIFDLLLWLYNEFFKPNLLNHNSISRSIELYYMVISTHLEWEHMLEGTHTEICITLLLNRKTRCEA